MFDYFPLEGLRGVIFFLQIQCDKVYILLHGICHSCMDIFHVKLYIPEVKYKKWKIKREKNYLILNFLRQRGWSYNENNYLVSARFNGA